MLDVVVAAAAEYDTRDAQSSVYVGWYHDLSADCIVELIAT